MEKPYSGLTARIAIAGTNLGYMNNVTLNLEKDVAEVLQFGSQYREKLPTIKNWTASSDGTVAFEAGGSQHKLYQAYESGELVQITIKLNEAVYFTGNALISSLSISGSPDNAMTLNANFEGSGGVTFTLPETVTVTLSSGIGGYISPTGETEPISTIKVAKGSNVAITCYPSAGKEADKYGLNGATPSTTITSNAFTLSAVNTDTAVYVTFKDAE